MKAKYHYTIPQPGFVKYIRHTKTRCYSLVVRAEVPSYRYAEKAWSEDRHEWQPEFYYVGKPLPKPSASLAKHLSS